MVRAAGADLVGMATVLEVIAARHLGAEVRGLSLVTNLAAGLSDQPLDHAEVVAAGQDSAVRMGTLLAEIPPRLASHGDGRQATGRRAPGPDGGGGHADARPAG